MLFGLKNRGNSGMSGPGKGVGSECFRLILAGDRLKLNKNYYIRAFRPSVRTGSDTILSENRRGELTLHKEMLAVGTGLGGTFQ